MATYLENTCDFLIHKIRDSGLNFSCQETPYSFYITLRKSFIKSRLTQPKFAISETSDLKEKFEKILARNITLENNSKQLQKEVEDLLEENKAAQMIAKNLQNQNDEKDALIDSLESSIKNLTGDFHSMEGRNKKLETESRGRTAECIELKNTKNLLEEKLKITESKLLDQFKKAEEEREKLDEKFKFLQDSVMRSTEETLAMENKLFETRKALKKVKKENETLKENLENNLKSEENPAGASRLATSKPMIVKNSEAKAVQPSPSKVLEFRKSFPPHTQQLKPFPPSPGLNPAETLQLRKLLPHANPDVKDTQDAEIQAFNEIGRAIKDNTQKFGKPFP